MTKRNLKVMKIVHSPTQSHDLKVESESQKVGRVKLKNGELLEKPSKLSRIWDAR